MSHFAVMVIGDNPEDQLAPYDENIQTAPRINHEVSDEEKERMIEYYKKNGIEYSTFDELYKKKGNDWNGNTWKKEGKMWLEYSTYNPDSKWDWYELGGRWTGFLKLKEGSDGEVDERRAESGYADAALKKDIDFDFMRNKAEKNASRWYDKVIGLIGHTEPNKPWSYFREKVENNEITIDEAREQYHEQPRLVEVKKHQSGFGFFFEADEFLQTKEQYVKTERDAAVSTFAVLKDGVWYEKGQMGWWAMVANEEDQDVWNSKVSELLDSVDDDTLISIYDCHF